jgi:hypothetical protein
VGNAETTKDKPVGVRMGFDQYNDHFFLPLAGDNVVE